MALTSNKKNGGISKGLQNLVAYFGKSKVQLLLPGISGRPLHSPVVVEERQELIRYRIYAISIAFAVLVLAWIPVDVSAFPQTIWAKLFIARIVAGVSFLILAYATRSNTKILSILELSALLFFIPTIFAGYSQHVLGLGIQIEGWSRFVFTAYALVPFIIISGFSLLPLTIFEVLIIATPIFVSLFTIEYFTAHVFDLYQFLGEIWLLALILGAAILAGTSQLHLLITLVEKNAQDPLTLAYTRRDGERILGSVFENASKTDLPIGLAFIDLDHFKVINDTFGHEAGDDVLKMMSKVVMNRIRATDFLIRWGGEEFLLVAPGTNAEDINLFASRVIGQGLGLRPDDKPLTASVGVSERKQDHSQTYEDLVRLADDRMYAAKQTGRNKIVSWEK